MNYTFKCKNDSYSPLWTAKCTFFWRAGNQEYVYCIASIVHCITGAVVAREYGLPCVVNAPGATHSFMSGMYEDSLGTECCSI